MLRGSAVDEHSKAHHLPPEEILCGGGNRRGRIVKLPYGRAVWDASVVSLADDPGGRRQLLILPSTSNGRTPRCFCSKPDADHPKPDTAWPQF